MTLPTRSTIRSNGPRGYSTTKYATYVFLFVCLGYFLLPLLKTPWKQKVLAPAVAPPTRTPAAATR